VRWQRSVDSEGKEMMGLWILRDKLGRCLGVGVMVLLREGLEV
jgi:hypothetical protein